MNGLVFMATSSTLKIGSDHLFRRSWAGPLPPLGAGEENTVMGV
jgi:hypothetical protein